MVYWVYKIWTIFWRTVLVLLVTVLLGLGTIFALLQWNPTQQYLANRLEKEFKQQYKGDLQIEKLDGVLPFDFTFTGVTITNNNSSQADSVPIFSVDTVSIQVDLTGLLRRSLTINQMHISSPKINLIPAENGGYTIQQALTADTTQSLARETWFERIDIVAPYLKVRKGRLLVQELPGDVEKKWHIPEPLRLNSINASLYIELTSGQRLLDIEKFEADIQDMKPDHLYSSGQIYNKDGLVEFNGFEIRTAHSFMDLSGQVRGVSSIADLNRNQLEKAYYSLSLDTARVNLKEWAGLFPRLPAVNRYISLSGSVDGNQRELKFDKVRLQMSNSLVRFEGRLFDAFEYPPSRYQFEADTARIYRRDLASLVLDSPHLASGNWKYAAGHGRVKATADSLHLNLRLQSDQGDLRVSGSTSLQVPFNYNGELRVKKLNLKPWLATNQIPKSQINASMAFEGVDRHWRDTFGKVTGSLTNSKFGDISLQQLDFEIQLRDGFIEPTLSLQNKDEKMNLKGWMDITETPTEGSFRGKAHHIDLQHYFTDSRVSDSRLNFEYDLEFAGHSLSTLSGRMTLDVQESLIDDDTVSAHSFYADLSETVKGSRQLRLTSTFLDAEIKGPIKTDRLKMAYNYWSSYLNRKLWKDFLMDTSYTKFENKTASWSGSPVNFELDMRLKDLSLLQKYFPTLPEIKAQTSINAELTTTARYLRLKADLQDTLLQVGPVSAMQPSMSLVANIEYGQSIDSFGQLNLQAAFEELNYLDTHLRHYGGTFQLNDDSLQYRHRVNRREGDVTFALETATHVRDSAWSTKLLEFSVGNEAYTWQSIGNPQIIYRQSGALALRSFRFQNENEEISIKGVFSSQPKEVVYYNFDNIKLKRVSRLIGGRINFSGTLNGEFQTRTLFSHPSIEGEIQVREFRLNDRIIGDLNLSSRYSPVEQHFNTEIRIQTDSTRYAEYLKQNEGVGQDIVLRGYLQAPAQQVKNKDKPYYKFNVDFRQIDMWVVRMIVPTIFDKVEGSASGEGWIAGDFNNYDFHSDFNVNDVHANTVFLNTNYWLNGHVEFDKQDGLVFHEVQLTDRKEGRGILTGRVDMNDFRPVKYFDLTLSMNQLQFLNNNMQAGVPFFGEMYGSGQLHLEGSNEKPYLRTTESIAVTGNSQLSIPLLDETELSQGSGFIRFVDRFDLDEPLPEREESTNEYWSEEELTMDESFAEVFRLDLQFYANQNTTVRLLFDRHAEEVLRARGTGQLNIKLGDEEVHMFGNYNINGGSYQFVSGDIFTREFQLQNGGQISWQGDPYNAELDVNTVYNARPSVQSLLGSRSTDNVNQRNIQSIPVELVLHITGTLDAVQNEFYFRLPNTMEISQNMAIANRISQLNRDAEQKLLQATSLLLTGEFIPVTGNGWGTQQPGLGENISGSSVVLNPLLSNQVFSPLLSNQINALLNSDISSLDLDINLNAYNQVDLGIALRLYDNRLVLRREGQVTGPQSNLGSLGATYRINQKLSVKAFHRQDLTLSSLSRAQMQIEYLNGAGIEARIQFNSWKNLTRRFINSIKRLFVSGDKAVRKKNENLASGKKSSE